MRFILSLFVFAIGAWSQAEAAINCPIRFAFTSPMIAPDGYPIRLTVVPVRVPDVENEMRSIPMQRVVTVQRPAGTYVIIANARGHKNFVKGLEHRCGSDPTRLQRIKLELKKKAMKTAFIRLPFANRRQQVRYYVNRHGDAVAFGDIVIGKAADIEAAARTGARMRYYRGFRPAPAPRRRPVKIARNGQVTIGQRLSVVTDPDLLWPDGVVPFEIGDGFTEAERNTIAQGMRNIENVSNVDFVERRPTDPDYITIVPFADPNKCGESHVGRIGLQQFLRLRQTGDCMDGTRTVVHELLHALGAYHEHQRPDRDAHIEIVEANMIDNESIRENLIAKSVGARTIGPYDYRSIMHYDAKAASKKGQPTIRCKADDCNASLMGADRMSVGDRRGLLLLYPGLLNYFGGENWGDGVHPNGAAIGDLNGDGKGEVLLTRNNSRERLDRVLVLDPSKDFEPLDSSFERMRGWGPGAMATGIATGNFDEDMRAEFVVTRKSTVNGRVFIYDWDADTKKIVLRQTLGQDWNREYFARHVAAGDLDGDGIDEIVVTTNGPNRANIILERDNGKPPPIVIYKRHPATDDGYVEAWTADNLFAAGYGASRVAIGRIDLDDKPDIAVTTTAGRKNLPRVIAFSVPTFGNFDIPSQISLLGAALGDWGNTARATDIAIGQYAEDVSDCSPDMVEAGQCSHWPMVAVSRKANVGLRVSVLRFIPDRNTLFQWTTLESEANAMFHVQRVAFGNFMPNSHSELIYGRAIRKFAKSDRYRVRGMAYTGPPFRVSTLGSDMVPMVGDQSVTAMASGDIDGNGTDELVVGMSKASPDLILSGGGGNFFGSDDTSDADRKLILHKRFVILNFANLPFVP